MILIFFRIGFGERGLCVCPGLLRALQVRLSSGQVLLMELARNNKYILHQMLAVRGIPQRCGLSRVAQQESREWGNNPLPCALQDETMTRQRIVGVLLQGGGLRCILEQCFSIVSRTI